RLRIHGRHRAPELAGGHPGRAGAAAAGLARPRGPGGPVRRVHRRGQRTGPPGVVEGGRSMNDQADEASAAALIRTLPPKAARLLAVEVLLADPESLADDVLESCLYILRERLSQS